MIDNELIGYGKGWLLDFYNSNISAVDDRVYSAIEQDVLTRSIYIREIGTALDKGAFKSVIVLADEYAKNICEDLTIIIRTVGERTTAACVNLVESQGYNESLIHQVNISPFQAALKECFE